MELQKQNDKPRYQTSEITTTVALYSSSLTDLMTAKRLYESTTYFTNKSSRESNNFPLKKSSMSSIATQKMQSAAASDRPVSKYLTILDRKYKKPNVKLTRRLKEKFETEVKSESFSGMVDLLSRRSIFENHQLQSITQPRESFQQHQRTHPKFNPLERFDRKIALSPELMERPMSKRQVVKDHINVIWSDRQLDFLDRDDIQNQRSLKKSKTQSNKIKQEQDFGSQFTLFQISEQETRSNNFLNLVKRNLLTSDQMTPKKHTQSQERLDMRSSSREVNPFESSVKRFCSSDARYLQMSPELNLEKVHMIGKIPENRTKHFKSCIEIF